MGGVVHDGGMPRLQTRRFATPDEVRTFAHGRAEVLLLDETAIGRATYEPGWRWTTDMPGIAGTATCQLHHLGYSISGGMHVVMDDGQEIDIDGQSVYEIPAGHDAWVVGDAPWVTVEWTSARTFGVAPEGPGERVLATVLFTDIVDSTVTMERIGDTAWRELLASHNRLLRGELNAFRGREIATTGDGFLAVFDGATRAVRCGAAMGRSADEIGLGIRVGIHTGEVEFVGAGRARPCRARSRPSDVLRRTGRGRHLVDDEGPAGRVRPDPRGRRRPSPEGLPGERQLFKLADPDAGGPARLATT